MASRAERFLRRLCLVMLLLSGLGVPVAVAQLPGPVAEQERAPRPGDVAGTLDADAIATPDLVDALVARLTDAQVRDTLIEVLNRQAEAQREGPAEAAQPLLAGLIRDIEALALEVSRQLGFLWAGVRFGGPTVDQALDRLSGGEGGAQLVRWLVSFALALSTGLVAAAVVRRALARRRGKADAPAGVGGNDRWSRAGGRAAGEAMSLLAFLLVTMGLSIALLRPAGPFSVLATSIVAAVGAGWTCRILSRAVLSPDGAGMRLVPLDDGDAGFLHRWIVRIVTLAVLAYLTADALVVLTLGFEAYFLFVAGAGLLVCLAVIVAIWQGRGRLSAAFKASAKRHRGLARSFRLALAESWHVLAIGYAIGLWLIWVLGLLLEGQRNIDAVLGSLVILAALPVADRLCGLMIARPVERPQATATIDAAEQSPGGSTSEPGEPGEPHPASGAEPGPFRIVAGRAARLVIVGVAGLWLLSLWDVDPFVHTHGPDATPFWSAVFDIGVSLALGWLAWQLIRAALDRHLPRIDGQAMADIEGSTVAADENARIKTLLPLLRNGLLTVLVVIVLMVILSSLGVSIGPLLASAGVVGIAIGFGAQTLVRDIFSGVFFLLDDAFRIGEYIEIGDVKGRVEKISIRSLRLRHHLGPIQTIPFGEIRSITNHMRDWIIFKMEFRLPFDTDVEQVRKLIKKLGQEMMQDPALAPKFLEPLKSQGIIDVDDSALIMRAKFSCRPGEQWLLRREAYRRITETLLKNGVRFAHRNVTVYAVPAAKDRTDDRGMEIAGAATVQTTGDLAPDPGRL